MATLATAQKMARALSGKTDVVVELADGVHRLSKPLEFTSADSGRNGHTVTWQAMPGATPMVSGGEPVTGWTLQDPGQNIWVASVPQGADSRQLYVDGALAPRASIPVSRNDVRITATGMTITNPALNFLATLPQQNRIEVESRNSFTNRYSPEAGIELSLRPDIGDVLGLGAAKCLDVNGTTTTPGTQLQIWACNGGSNQIWTHTPSGRLTVYSGSDTRCMAALNNQTTSGTPVVISQCTGTTGQQWQVNPNGTITAVQSGLCLDIAGPGTANGTRVQLWTCNGQANQQWTLG